MIFAKLKDAADYRGIHPRLDRVIDCLNLEFLESVGTEMQKLEEDLLYVTRFDYETLPLEETFFEAHKRYLDVHLLLRGEERVDISHPDTLALFEHKDDFYAYRGEAEQTLILTPGSFLVVFPGDAHRIKIQAQGPSNVSKVVFKLLVNDEGADK